MGYPGLMEHVIRRGYSFLFLDGSDRKLFEDDLLAAAGVSSFAEMLAAKVSPPREWWRQYEKDLELDPDQHLAYDWLNKTLRVK